MKRSFKVVPKVNVSANTVVTSSAKIDLSRAIELGKECIEDLRKVLPDIPKQVTYRRSHAWSDCWYVTFYLQVSIKKLAREYQEESNVDDPTSAYWEYIDSTRDKCSKIVKSDKYYNKDFQCAFQYYNETNYGYPGAVLIVYSLNDPV